MCPRQSVPPDMKNRDLRVRIGQSLLRNTGDAAAQLGAQLAQPGVGLVVVFAGSNHDLDHLCVSLRSQMPDAKIVGSTAAGEIGPNGYGEGSIVGFSFHRDDVVCEVGLVEPLSGFNAVQARRFAHALRERLRDRIPGLNQDDMFAFMLIDGISAREENVVRAFHEGMDGIPLVGGSAGAAPAPSRTRLIHDGRVVGDAAILVVCATSFPFSVFKTQHFVAGDIPLVVTGAIPAQRVITELNGLPAAQEYADAIGVARAFCNDEVFAANPLLVRIGEAGFVRSIQRASDDGALTFYCAIDEGLVLRPGRNMGMLETLAETFEGIRTRLGEPVLTLGFDCILRQIEICKTGLEHAMGTRLREVHTIGFGTFGEQYCGMHVNQTMTGIAFGKRLQA